MVFMINSKSNFGSNPESCSEILWLVVSSRIEEVLFLKLFFTKTNSVLYLLVKIATHFGFDETKTYFQILIGIAFPTKYHFPQQTFEILVVNVAVSYCL